MLPRFRYVAAIAAGLALIAPAYTLIRIWLDSHYSVGAAEAVLWTTSIMLMATDGREHTMGAYVIVAISIAANMIVYIIASALLWSVAQRIRAIVRWLRGGTAT